MQVGLTDNACVNLVHKNFCLM